MNALTSFHLLSAIMVACALVVAVLDYRGNGGKGRNGNGNGKRSRITQRR